MCCGLTNFTWNRNTTKLKFSGCFAVKMSHTRSRTCPVRPVSTFNCLCRPTIYSSSGCRLTSFHILLFSAAMKFGACKLQNCRKATHSCPRCLQPLRPKSFYISNNAMYHCEWFTIFCCSWIRVSSSVSQLVEIRKKICIRLVFPLMARTTHFHNFAINFNQHSP